VANACRKYGKVLGMGGINGQEDSARYIGMGARFVTNASDHAYLLEGARARTGFLRGLTVGELAETGKKPGKAKAKRDKTEA
jgi:hypothetical protein